MFSFLVLKSTLKSRKLVSELAKSKKMYKRLKTFYSLNMIFAVSNVKL